MKKFIVCCALFLIMSVQAMEEEEKEISCLPDLPTVDNQEYTPKQPDDRGVYESFLFAPSKSDVINLIQKIRVPVSRPHIALNVLRNNNLLAVDLKECIGMLGEQEKNIEDKEILDALGIWVNFCWNNTRFPHGFIDAEHRLTAKGYCYILRCVVGESCGYSVCAPVLPKQKMFIFAVNNGADLLHKRGLNLIGKTRELPACMSKLIELRGKEKVVPIVIRKKNEVISPQHPLCAPQVPALPYK